jgi:xanthine dehydrogenase YagR molybdenum-binding subunit
MNDAAASPDSQIGKPIARIDARLKVTGEALYPADIPIQNLAHAVLVTSPIASGRLTQLHVDEAHAVPGVLEIIGAGDIDGDLARPQFGNSSSTSIAPLHERKIWHDGQIIALVVAETAEAASQAAELVHADYETGTPSGSFDASGIEVIPAAGASPMHPEDPGVGDFASAYASSDVSVDQHYSTPTQHHNPMELFSTTASWVDGSVTVNESSQNVTGWKIALAKQLKVDPEQVRIVSPYVGGAFGSRGPMTPRTAIIAHAARRIGRPVRCVVSRRQAYTTQTYRAETRHRIQIGARKDGKIVAFRHEGWEVTSRPDNYVVGGTGSTARLYGYGAVETKVSLVKADRNTPSYMRSPPETPYVYALENAMDEMAIALDMDPVEFRRVNDTMNEPIEGKPFSSRSLMECYDQAAAAFGWNERTREVGSMRDGDWLVGMGCATALYPTNVAPCTARVSLGSDGRVRVQSGSHEIGTGIRTVAAQMASEMLGVPFDAVDVEMGDSSLPPAPVSGGSNSTASVCSAVMKACDAIRAKLFHAAVTANDGALAGAAPGEVRVTNGSLVAGDRTEAIKDTIDRIGVAAIEEYAEFTPEGASADAIPNLYKGKLELQMGEKGPKVKYAFGAEFVEVRIHRMTKEIRVPRLVGAFAAGRIMNPRTARSQLIGGMIWGVGCALHEATEIDRRTARYVNTDLQDYLVPVNADIRDVEVILVEEEDRDVNPAGVKGLGELGNVGTPAAISSAVYHATGKRVRDLPIRIEDLL